MIETSTRQPPSSDAVLRDALENLEKAAQAHLDCTDGSEREYLRDELFNARAALSSAPSPAVGDVCADEVNALPDRVRAYIHHLETDCDPQGTIRENFRLREENANLRVECQNLAALRSQPAMRLNENDLAMLSSLKHASDLYNGLSGGDVDDLFAIIDRLTGRSE